MDNLHGIEEAKLKSAIEMIKQVMGPAETAKIEKVFDSKGSVQLNLSEKELRTVKTVLENPEMLRTILSSRKAREILSEYLNKM